MEGIDPKFADLFDEDKEPSEWDSDEYEIPYDKYFTCLKGLRSTPFIEFCKDFHKKLIREYPGVTANDEYRCTLGTWNKMSKKERHKYFNRARKANTK